MKHKVVALDTYERIKIADKYEGHVKEGQIFEVDDERLKVLLGENQFHLAFVKLYEEPVEEKTEANEETKEENKETVKEPKKRGRKKKE